MQQSRVGEEAPGRSGPAPSSSGTGNPVIQMMRGQELSQQLETLAPRENARGPKGPGGEPVQMKIDLGTLEAKLQAGESYSGTIDTDTDCATANSVGEAWVGAHDKIAYGPPFNFQLVSKDKKRAYRPPMVKQSGQQRGNAQANYQARTGEGAGYPFNAHVTVTDIASYQGGGGGGGGGD